MIYRLMRVKAELKELQERIEKLQHFLSSDAIKTITIRQMSLLSQQLYIMKEYENVLKERIADGETNDNNNMITGDVYK